MADDSTTNFGEESENSTDSDPQNPNEQSPKKRKCLEASCILIWVAVLVLALGVSFWSWVIPYAIQEEVPDADVVAKLVGENNANCVYTGTFARDRKGFQIFCQWFDKFWKFF